MIIAEALMASCSVETQCNIYIYIYIYIMYKKSFVVVDGYYPPVCYLSHRNPPLIPFLDQKNHSNSDKITKCFVRMSQDYF